MNTRDKSVFTSVLLLVVLAGGIMFTRHIQHSSHTTRTDTLHWQSGTAQQYQVQTNSQIQIATVKTGTVQTLQVQLQGVLDMQTLETSNNAAVIGMRFRSVDFLIGGKTDPATNQALTTPFRVRFVAGGIPESFEFPADIASKNRDILQNLIRMFQVSMHSDSTWTAREVDANGSYDAVYKRTSVNDIFKTKHDLAGSTNNSLFKDSVFQSKSVIRIGDQHDWIKEMLVDDTRNTKNLSDFNLKIQNHASIKLILEKAQLSHSIWNFVASAALTDSADQNQTISRLTPEQARQQMLSVLGSLNTAEKDRIIWIHRLRDLLRVDSTLPDALLNELKAGQLSDRTQADIYLALEEAGNVAAQKALVSVISDPAWSQRHAMRAIVALAGIKEPTPETLSALWQAANRSQLHTDRHRLVSTATYALGSIGGAMNAVNNPAYPALRAQLEQGALTGGGSADDIEIRMNYVNALGNTRDKTLSNTLTDLLDDSAPSIRRAAALSLNTIGVDEAADKLLLRFNQEQNRSVRSAMVESLVNWSSPTQSALAGIAAQVRTEPYERARYYMAQFLGNHLDTYPGNRQVLQDLLRTEPSQRIRQSVADALATSKSR